MNSVSRPNNSLYNDERMSAKKGKKTIKAQMQDFFLFSAVFL
jgi:hypothetical protein